MTQRTGPGGAPPQSRAPSSLPARLVRWGFADAAKAVRLLESPALAGVAARPDLVEALGATADPDLAVLALSRLMETAEGAALLDALGTDPHLRRRLFGVLGMSTALGDHLARHPEHWRDLREGSDDGRPTAYALRESLLRAVGAVPGRPMPRAADASGAGDRLRVAYRRHLLRLAARDLDEVALATARVSDVSAELADLAAATLEAALAVARAELTPVGGKAPPPVRLAIIALGKTGGRELNYVSDVDVVFVAEPVPGADDDGEGAEREALRTATRLATLLMRICSDHTAEGTIWPVDAALRPEGKDGPLVRTLASHVAYYRQWAKTWEFQALLKARPVAGDLELGQAYVEAVAPLVWAASERPNFVEDVQQMRRRVEQHVRRSEANRQIKLGPGGLRDVEFSVQLLQLVHGRGDPTVRSGNTLAALRSLTDGGYVGRLDGAELDEAYRFLRTLEHRIQLQRLRRTHLVPDSEPDLRRLGRSLGFAVDPVTALVRRWTEHGREVRRLHEKLFYRPLLAAVARLPGEQARLSLAAASQQLEALGYRDPAGALRHLEALTNGVSRRAAIQKTLLPVMLGWFADGPDPDAGLAGFRAVSDALGETHWYLRMLRDGGAAAERMARVLASSRYATELLQRAPESVAMLGEDAELVPRTAPPLVAEVVAAVARQTDPVVAIEAVRAMSRRERFRVAVADLIGRLGADEVGEAMTAVVIASVTGALDAATAFVASERRGALPTRLAVVAMGRVGGYETGYGSDVDVLFVHDPLPGADERDATEAATAVANELRRLLAIPSPEPPLVVDAALRPEGRQGPLVRTLDSYAAYYARWSEVWERQALLKASPLAGDADLLARFFALVDPLRYPEGGLDDAAVREVRRIKARVEAERLPRGADPTTHLKLGRGGLSDVEWTVQLLQLRHAAVVPGLRTTRTVAACDAAVEAGLLHPDERSELLAAWRTATSLRNAVMLVRNRAADEIPRDLRDRSAVSRVLGYGPGESTAFVEDYRRVTRRARAVVERVFYAG